MFYLSLRSLLTLHYWFYLFSSKPKEFSQAQQFIIAILYLGGGCIFLTKIPYTSNNFAKYLITGIFYFGLGERHFCLFSRQTHW